jgi:chemotaxis signal transduction protein
MVGQTIGELWSAATLQLRNSQDFHVSTFAPSSFYGGRPTFVYGAALRDSGRAVGGVGIVFDTQPQLESILRDALPRTDAGDIAPGCISLFVDANLRVVAASSRYEVNASIDLPRELLSTSDGGSGHLVSIGEMTYAVGVRRTSGYREYHATTLWCLILIPLGNATRAVVRQRNDEAHGMQRQMSGADQRAAGQVVDVATFHCNGQWLGLLREQIIEAIDGAQLRAVPNSPAWHSGLVMFRGTPIPVVDLARLMDNKSSTQGRDVIVIRTSSDGPAMGLLVDDLAGIPSIPISRLLPMHDASQRAGNAIIDHAVRPERPDDPLLLILNIEQLVRHTHSAQTVSAVS